MTCMFCAPPKPQPPAKPDLRPLHAVAMPGDRRTICGIRFGSGNGGNKDAGLPYCWRGHEFGPSHAARHQAKGGPLCDICWSQP